MGVPSAVAEWRLPPEEWVVVAAIVQMVLNNTKLESLANEAPITCMTGLLAMTPLAPIVTSLDMGVTTCEEIAELKEGAFEGFC